ncbi:MAG: tetratricopeptide repeat protein [Acidobacteria bacterium]|nr:tetratricopeptide repeat protein [Acidobacteriota bacterium]
MDRITRKSLKEDKFAAEVTHSVEYLAEHRRQTMLYGGVGAAVLVVVLGGYLYWQHRKSGAHEALANALASYRAIITDEDRPGRITFRSEAAKNAKALGDFEGVAKSYGRMQEGQIARYYIGVIQHQMGKLAEAQKTLEQVAAEGKDGIPPLARLALADVYLAQGKGEEARKIYDYLLKNPSDTVPETRAQLAMVRYLRNTKPDEARKMLQDLIKRPGPVAAAASNMLREMGQ